MVANGCNFSSHQEPPDQIHAPHAADSPSRKKDPIVEEEPRLHPLAERMAHAGMVDVQTLEPSLVVDLKYASEDNFMGKNLYDGLQQAFLQPEVAGMLARAQELLHQHDASLSLVIYDAARPRSMQQQMFDALDVPFAEKIKFLANPANGSVHNFGAAVDVSIIDSKGRPLDMGTPYDTMGELAYPVLEDELLASGKLHQQQIDNRRLLRKVMREAGFQSIRTEWWHFNAMSRRQARARYPILE